QRFDGVRDCLGVPGAIFSGMIEEGGQIVTMRSARDGLQPAPDTPEHATRGFAVAQQGGLIALDRLAHGQSRIPCTQHGEFVGGGEAGRVVGMGGQYRGAARFHARKFNPEIGAFR
ncbi:hypothetical protein HDG35_006507, partial [Paraburkholderia sp. JPY681]|nr:hypothetical protein [Paraburkholderia atlantica]